MALKKHVSRSKRLVTMTNDAKKDLEHSAEQFSATARTVLQYATELRHETENLKQAAIGAQAEAVRACMYALSARATAERLALIALLKAEEENGS